MRLELDIARTLVHDARFLRFRLRLVVLVTVGRLLGIYRGLVRIQERMALIGNFLPLVDSDVRSITVARRLVFRLPQGCFLAA